MYVLVDLSSSAPIYFIRIHASQPLSSMSSPYLDISLYPNPATSPSTRVMLVILLHGYVLVCEGSGEGHKDSHGDFYVNNMSPIATLQLNSVVFFPVSFAILRSII